MIAAEFAPGVLIQLPAGHHPAHPGRPYCLLITSVISVSKATGAVDVLGEVRALDGTTTRRKPLFRRVTVIPERARLLAAAHPEEFAGLVEAELVMASLGGAR